MRLFRFAAVEHRLNMSIFGQHHLETMNESDVAGEIVRPFCKALGYLQGDPVANLRSEVFLQYERMFLGRKDPSKDPVLRGRPDFICDVVAHGRWVVEAKRPSVDLTVEHSYQAHTYARHPEIAAEYYLLTNGREFRLYRTVRPEEPVLRWLSEETDEKFPIIANVLSPAAIARLAATRIDTGKPLRPGWPSEMKIVGGEIVYEKSESTVRLEMPTDGMRSSIVGRSIARTADGFIEAVVEVKTPFAAMDEFSTSLGFSPLRYRTAEEYLSGDPERPTFMQNVMKICLPRGASVPDTPMFRGISAMPIRVSATCYTQVVGFCVEDKFQGSFVVDYDYDIEPMFGSPLPSQFQMRQTGTFEIRGGRLN